MSTEPNSKSSFLSVYNDRKNEWKEVFGTCPKTFFLDDFPPTSYGKMKEEIERKDLNEKDNSKYFMYLLSHCNQSLWFGKQNKSTSFDDLVDCNNLINRYENALNFAKQN